MNLLAKLVLAALVMLGCVNPHLAMAGSQANAVPKHSAEQIVSFAKGLERQLAQDGARAAIIARSGRPANELPKGISFTHTAVAIYSQITLDSGKTAYGYAIHNLYQTPDDGSASMLVTDYPVDFFWGATDLRAGIIVPSAEVQKRIIALVSTGKHVELHNPQYSVLANPHNDMYQNCTEFTLDMINAALYDTTDRKRLKSNAKQYFSPQKIHQSRLKLSLGSMLMKDLTLRDHKRKVSTATFGTLATYMQQYGLSKKAYVINDDLSLREI